MFEGTSLIHALQTAFGGLAVDLGYIAFQQCLMAPAGDSTGHHLACFAIHGSIENLLAGDYNLKTS